MVRFFLPVEISRFIADGCASQSRSAVSPRGAATRRKKPRCHAALLVLHACTGTAVPSPTTPLNPSFGWIPLRQLSRPFDAVFRRSTWVEEAFSIERNPFDRGQKKITENAKKKPHTRALLSGTPTFLGFVDGESLLFVSLFPPNARSSLIHRQCCWHRATSTFSPSAIHPNAPPRGEPPPRRHVSDPPRHPPPGRNDRRLAFDLG